MVKVAIVGVGGISRAHISAWEKLEDAQLVALCDIRPEMMKEYTDKHCYTDFDEMLQQEEIHIVDICLPTYLHATYSIKAMEKGKHVLCEKPISLSRDDVKRVYETAEQYNVRFMVAQVLRFWPEYEVLKKLYEEQPYGKLLSGNMTRLSQIPGWSWDGWMTDETRSGFVPYDLHIHDLDFLVYAFGIPQQVSQHRSKQPDQDYVQAVYDFDGFFVSTEAAWYAAPMAFSASFRFQFERAVAIWQNGVLVISEKDGKTFQPVGSSDAHTGNIGLPASDAYTNEIRYFLDCVKTEQSPTKVQPKELEAVIDILNEF